MKTFVDSEEYLQEEVREFGFHSCNDPVIEKSQQFFAEPKTGNDQTGSSSIQIASNLWSLHVPFQRNNAPCDLIIIYSESETNVHRLRLFVLARGSLAA